QVEPHGGAEEGVLRLEPVKDRPFGDARAAGYFQGGRTDPALQKDLPGRLEDRLRVDARRTPAATWTRAPSGRAAGVGETLGRHAQFMSVRSKNVNGPPAPNRRPLR